MKISKRKKRIISYIFIPVIMAVLGYGIIFVAARPVINLASNVFNMVLSKTMPNFSSELESVYDENAKVQKDGIIKKSDIVFPGYEVRYGELFCDRLNMDVKVFWGDTDRVFKEGAGQYIGSFLPGFGHMVLLGAHDSLYFEPLQDVKNGDVFVLRTNYGEFQYRVTETKIADAKDSELFFDNSYKEQLILYTCYPFGALIGIKDQRFYVCAEKIAGPVISEE